MGRRSNLIAIGISVLTGCLFWGSCSKENNPVKTDDQQTAVQTFTSTTGGKIETPSGNALEVIPGVVPGNQNGTPATVAFSVESPVQLPAPLPSGATQVGSCTRFGPVGFLFNWPVRVILSYPEGNDPASLFIMRYNAAQEKWFVVPASYADASKRVVGADVLELGEFVLVKLQGMGKLQAPDSQGGFEYGGESGYYYALTVKSVTFKYPAQAAWFNLVGVVAGASGSGPTGGPLQPTHAILPQGTYEIWITRTKPGTLTELPKTWTYTIPARGTIDNPLTSWGYGNTTGWTTLNSPSGGEWREGRPGEWPQPTNPMGTGEFQATLNWVNTSTTAADLDLHLYGPNNMHVYFGEDVSSDGSVMLDRDWQEETGNAVENIFSVKQMPKGSYTVKVHHFSGQPKSYTVRVIRFGSVRTWSGSISNGSDMHVITNFSIN
ncbi:MAG: hypothetical protein QHI48_00405 [Bacteroidota bacterium]|nr:hypothetical protein [Bacteroidota bacterium]